MIQKEKKKLHCIQDSKYAYFWQIQHHDTHVLFFLDSEYMFIKPLQIPQQIDQV